jgi:hypothetical protein
MQFGCRRRVSASGDVNLFTTLRTISSNGGVVNPPPCMRRAARAIRILDGGQWGDDLAAPTTSIARAQASDLDELDGRASLPYQRTGVGRRPGDGGT